MRKNTSSSVISTTTYNYTYDANGNITKITDGSGVIQYKYAYDALGQLTREDNRAKGYTYVYTYDNAGNITSKKRYAFTTGTLGSVQQTYSYTYNDSTWKDLLTSYNGTNITYDTIGNPTAIGSRELTWQGRELKTCSDGYYSTTTYYYNADGIRTRKEIYNEDYGETQTHEYILSGSQIVRETVYFDEIEQYTLVYIYDELGAPIGIKYRTPSYAADVYDCYFFEKNLQGDIVAIYNASGTKIATYTYDAWGNVTTQLVSGSTSNERILAVNNPFRYRGYYYDIDMGMYYLQSRYYNPTWGRFLNGDEVSYLGINQDLISYNLFPYCSNDPIQNYDPTGMWTFSIGFNYNFFCVAGVSKSYYLTLDDDGNFGIQKTEANAIKKHSGAIFGLYGAGISPFGLLSGVDTIYDLEGTGHTLNVDKVIIGFSDDKITSFGYSLNGLSVGSKLSFEVNKTETIASINIFDTIDYLWKKFKSIFD